MSVRATTSTAGPARAGIPLQRLHDGVANGGTLLCLCFRKRCAFGGPHHGPFVMNTHAELRQAFDDFQNGRF